VIPHALVLDGRVVAERDGDRIVPWWSFTKTALAATALTLVRDGELALDGAIDGRPWTLRQLLRHQAGLPDYGDLPEYAEAVARGEMPWPAERMLVRAEVGRLRYPPGEGWAYSNIGYLQVGALIEGATGRSLAGALQRRLLGPLDIDRVLLARDRADLTGVDMGHAPDYDPGWVYHGLLVGPLRNAALLLDRLLRGDLLPPELLAAMRDAHPVGGAIDGRPWRTPGYGLGLMTGGVEGGITIEGHTGGGPGSSIAVFHAVGLQPGRTAAIFGPGETADKVEREAIALMA
jgi:CubicO group peptidase (beta-lactamase class C family)